LPECAFAPAHHDKSALRWAAETLSDVSVLYEDPGSGCEECGQVIDGPLVVRQGVHYLAWHRWCAASQMDSREAALVADPEPRWRRRQLAGVRHRLVAEEQVA